MCPPKKQVNDFALKVNENILSRNIASVPKQITEFEKKGYSVFYKVISPKRYMSESFNSFWNKTVSGLKHGKSYQGTLIFTPIINWNNNYKIIPNKENPIMKAYSYITEKSLEIHNDQCALGHYYDKHDNPTCSKDENMYVMIVYKGVV